MGLDEYEINSDGSIVRYENDDNSNSYVYIDGDGNQHTIGTYTKNDNGYIQLSDINYDNNGVAVQVTAKPGNESEMYVSGNAMASLIGASADSGEEIYVTRVSNSDGSSPGSSQSHIGGNNFDSRYAQNNGSRAALNYEGSLTEFNKIDQTASASMNAGLDKFGWKDIKSSTLSISNTTTVNGVETTTTTDYNVSGTNHLSNHYNHQHIQGYSPNISTRTRAPERLTPLPFRPLQVQ